MASRLRRLLALVTLLSLLSLNAGGAKAGVNTSETPGLMEDILTLSISVSSYELMAFYVLCGQHRDLTARVWYLCSKKKFTKLVRQYGSLGC